MTKFHNCRAKTVDFLSAVYFGPSRKFSSSLSIKCHFNQYLSFKLKSVSKANQPILRSTIFRQQNFHAILCVALQIFNSGNCM